MTDQAWSKLSARERDAAVAEKVMGWKATPPDWQHIIHPKTRLTWTPTSDPRDMLEVIEEMRRRGFGLLIGTVEEGWEVEVSVTKELYEAGHRGNDTVAATLPEAVALASLRACEAAVTTAEGKGVGR